MVRVAIIDYGAGNLRSLKRALGRAGADSFIAGTPKELGSAGAIVLPGVGAFGPAVRHLGKTGMTDAIRSASLAGTPLLGICLGLQLAADDSDEGSGEPGLGLVRGHVSPLDLADSNAKRLHIGWSRVTPRTDDRLDGEFPPIDGHFYFAHAYTLTARDASLTIATATYAGAHIPSVIASGNFIGCQFHPELSGTVGQLFLETFLAYAVGRTA